MSKLLFAEDIGSSRLRKVNLILIIWLGILPSTIFPQIERISEKIFLNGFGRYIFVDNQFTLYNIFSFDLDGDGVIDIGGLDESGKNLIVYYGQGFNKFTSPVRYSLGGKFTGIQVRNLNLNDRVNLIAYSKVEGIIKIFSFYKRVISPFLNLKVDCCFSEIVIVNLDKSPQLELVLYGQNFKGIGIITFENNKYDYRKVGEETYAKLVPIFLNSDNKIDFVGYNPLKRELHLLRNNSIYNYSTNIYDVFDERIDEILSGNFNDDIINDIVLISNVSNVMYVLLGNGVGNFSNKFKIKTISKYTDNVVFDYNRDLIDDFIIYDRNAKKIYLKTIASDYSRIISFPLSEIEKLYSLASYRTTTTKGVAFSTNQGIFLIVYSSLSFDNEKYSISSNPSDLITYRVPDELYPKLIFIDRGSNRLNIVTRNEFNAPQEIFSIPLSYSYEKIKIIRAKSNKINLVCFKQLNYHFDYFEIDLRNGNYLRENLAIDGLIKDIGQETSTSDKVTLNVIVQSKNEIRTIIIKPFEVNKVILNESISDNNFLDFSFDFTSRTFFFVNKDLVGNQIHLWSKKFDQTYKKFELTKTTSIKNQDFLSVKLTLCDFFSDTKFALLNLSNLKEDMLLLIPVKNPTKYFSIDKILINDFGTCRCEGENSFSQNNFYFYNELSKSFEKIVFSGKGKPINYSIRSYPSNTIFSVDYNMRHKSEIVYISNYSIFNIERITE
ncbi:MAG: VCBS repeat-containing protein [Ignavibacteria bacterium]|nr:VCBS repeat-containing protein [Ignavibacteria bacterium]